MRNSNCLLSTPRLAQAWCCGSRSAKYCFILSHCTVPLRKRDCGFFVCPQPSGQTQRCKFNSLSLSLYRYQATVLCNKPSVCHRIARNQINSQWSYSHYPRPSTNSGPSIVASTAPRICAIASASSSTPVCAFKDSYSSIVSGETCTLSTGQKSRISGSPY